MKRTIGKIIVGGGLVVALAACGTSTQTGSATGNTAPVVNAAPTAPANNDSITNNPPVAANNDSTTNNPPVPGNTAPNGMPGVEGRGGVPGVIGTVVAVNGSTITIQDLRQQSTTTVDMTSETHIFKQATINIANVPVGKQISAMGSLDGGVFMATQISVGMPGPGGMMGRNGPRAAPGGVSGQGQPPSVNGPDVAAPPPLNGTAQPGGLPSAPNGRAGPGRGNALFGTVEQVSGDTITVKTIDGTTTPVKLASNGHITEQVTGATTDITANTRIAVLGRQNGTSVTASQIDILPAMTQMR